MSDDLIPQQPPDEQRLAEMTMQIDLDDRAEHLVSRHRREGLQLTAVAVLCGASWISTWAALGLTHPFSLASAATFLAGLGGTLWFWLRSPPPQLTPPGYEEAPLLRVEVSTAPLGEPVLVDLYQPVEASTIYDFPVVPLGGALYTVARVPAILEARSLRYRDVVQLRGMPNGTHALERIHARAGWSRHDSLVSREVIDSKELSDLLAQVVERGGTWVRDYEGCLTVAMPPGSWATWDYEGHLEQVFASVEAPSAP